MGIPFKWRLIRKSAVAIVALAVLSVAAAFFGSRLPSSFLPDEDQGYVYVNMQLRMLLRLRARVQRRNQVEQILANTPGVQLHHERSRLQPAQLCQDQLQRFFFVTLKPWERSRNTSGTVSGD